MWAATETCDSWFHTHYVPAAPVPAAASAALLVAAAGCGVGVGCEQGVLLPETSALIHGWRRKQRTLEHRLR